MQNALRALAKSVADYTEIHQKCWGLKPEEVKELMTMNFPLVQTFAMQNLVRELGNMPYDSKAAAAEIKEIVGEQPTTAASENAGK
jgi:hypothetical protein